MSTELQIYAAVIFALSTSPLWVGIPFCKYLDWRDARDLKRYGRTEDGGIARKPR